MPANNSKIMSQQMLQKLNMKYQISYDSSIDKIVVSLSTCKRVTVHDADKPFHVNAKKYGRKVCFNMTMIDIWKELTQDKKTSKMTLFDVHNAATALKVMYQPVTKQKIVEYIRRNFTGIKQI